MKTLITFLSILYLLSPGKQHSPVVQKPIGFVKENNYVFSDSISLKTRILRELSTKSNPVGINKMEIIEVATLGDKKTKEYLLVCYDYNKKRKISRCLHLIADKFYLEEDLDIKTVDDDYFYGSYFVTYDCDEDCSPYVAILDGRKKWISNKQMICVPDSQCKSATVFVESE